MLRCSLAWVAISEQLTPFLRVLGAVKNGVNDETISGRFVEYFKRESPDESTPEIVRGDRKHERMSQRQKQTCLDAPQKILATPRVAFLRPIVGRRHVVRSLWGEDDFFNHGGRVPAV